MNFHRFNRNAGYKPIAGVIIGIPLANIFFLFFMLFVCASGYFNQVSIVLNPAPAGGYSPCPAFNELIVRDGENIFLNGKAISPERITERLKALFPRERVLVIKASETIPLSLLSDIWGKCRRAGAARINILTGH